MLNRVNSMPIGYVSLWKSQELPWVFNLATPESYGRTGATYEAIERSLELMKRQAEEEAIATIAMPRIGSGYGGLSWKKARIIIERVFADWPGTLYVYEEYIPDST